jgi:DNA-binding CsgD family transcriptional regulator
VTVLVERDDALAQLRAAAAGLPPGRFALVAGEAGSGKTALLRAFLRDLTGEVLIGHCDSLGTARPLGPILDWTGGVLPTSIVDVVRGARVAVVEDAHWIDDASLDLLTQLVRRNAGWSGLLVLSYRDDEVGPAHPLGRLIGEIARQAPVRVVTQPLSKAGIVSLAVGSGLSVDDLHDRTGGNAFFVTECLAAAGLELTANVRDAVLARAAQLPAADRTAIDAVAVIPGRCELWLAEALGAEADALDALLSSGLLVAAADGSVALRHELAREALRDALPPGRNRALNRAAVTALGAPAVGAVDHARVVHHAVLAQDSAAVVEHAALAAAVAEVAGARGQAVAHLELALSHAPAADLWERLAVQLQLLGRTADAIDAFRAALTLVADDAAAGSLHAKLATPLATAGRLPESQAASREAVRLLERSGPSTGLAYAYAQMCAMHMLARELDEAARWGQRALALARELGDEESETYTAIQAGVAGWMAGDPEGLRLLQEGLALARARGQVPLVALGLSQIGSGGGEIRRYAEAVPALELAVAWAAQHELIGSGLYSASWLGRCQVELGRWDQAATTLVGVLGSPAAEGISRMTALTALGRLRARRGDPDAWEVLDQALEVALPSRQLQRIWPVVCARAEAAWLAGGTDREVELLLRTHAMAEQVSYPRAREELAFWLGRAGTEVARSTETPFGLHREGRYVEAAAAWAVLGCPYEQADALAESPVDEHQRQAIALLEALGAAPALKRLVGRRRAAGLPVPRGPNALTRGNPAGLTDRELEVLEQLGTGRTNAEIATELHISAKTVGHHVGHVLDKLGARTRAEAVQKAVELQR